MRRTQIIAVIIAVAAVGVLYSLPKVIVSDKDKKVAASQAATAQTDAAHAQSNEVANNESIKSLTNQYRAAADKEKKIIFADSLAALYRQALVFDSVVVYREVVVGLAPTLPNTLAAADACYDAFFFAGDAQKSAPYGEKARAYYQKVLDKEPNRLEVKAKMAMTYANSANPMQAVM
nr:hypothetical protein [Cytophagales bacterium]